MECTQRTPHDIYVEPTTMFAIRKQQHGAGCSSCAEPKSSVKDLTLRFHDLWDRINHGFSLPSLLVGCDSKIRTNLMKDALSDWKWDEFSRAWIEPTLYKTKTPFIDRMKALRTLHLVILLFSLQREGNHGKTKRIISRHSCCQGFFVFLDCSPGTVL